MEIKFNYFWGILGVMGLLGYVLENPIYYVLFAFFLLFLIPIFNKSGQNEDTKPAKRETSITEEIKSYNRYNWGMWLGSAILMVDSLVLIIWKTMNDVMALGILLGIIFYISSFFTYIGMEKHHREERLRKIGTTAATYSWYFTLVFLCFLVVNMFWAQNWHNTAEILGLTIFIMVTTMISANTYLNFKGDIE
ncbi:MAG: hypothetical protein PWQ15_1838 [Methanobacterium sp.]|jgi:hypothetical protein|uniref:hypothetical protein n=1 Tax=Methanobacterium sp. TaxID=2164 RepID=UPI0024AB68F2|nr:hypothetical protein [Methanobacterium sp.]MDI3550735.1 hypothetical protein [Methanobacterium sp.]